MTEVHLDNWEDILGEFERFAGMGYLFRGQGNSKWDLATSLERHAPPEIKRSDAERTLLHEFKRRAHTYLESQHIPAADDAGEWLALMQHFGAPTRLLDVTESPYVALYFAVEEIGQGVESCAVWAVNRYWCVEEAGRVALKGHPELCETQSTAAEDGRLPEYTPEYLQGLDSSVLKGDEWIQKHTAVVVPFVPIRLSERLSIQQGQFLVPRDVDRSFMENLAQLGETESGLVKFVIPASRRPRILERLRAMNITRAQLFPGLDGYAQSFRQFLLGESRDERIGRTFRQGLLVPIKVMKPITLKKKL